MQGSLSQLTFADIIAKIEFVNLRLLYTFPLLVLSLISCESRFSNHAIPSAHNEISLQDHVVKSYIQENIQSHLGNVNLSILKGRSLKADNWPTGSFFFLKTALSKDSLNPTILELAADYSLHASNLDSAFYYSTLAEKYGAHSAQFYRLKSKIYNQKGEYDRAIDYINKAILINRSDFESYYNKGKIYLSFGDTISALKFMKIGLRQYRNNYEVLYEVSGIYEKTGQYKEAEKLIDEAISFAPNSEILKIKKSEILLDQNKNDEAKNLLKASFMEDSTRFDSGVLLADLYRKMFAYDSALKISNLILETDSMNLDALLVRARTYDQRGFFTSAIHNYEQVLAIDSLHQDARVEWEKVKRKRAYLQKLKEEQEAIPTFDFFIQRKEKI